MVLLAIEQRERRRHSDPYDECRGMGNGSDSRPASGRDDGSVTRNRSARARAFGRYRGTKSRDLESKRRTPQQRASKRVPQNDAPSEPDLTDSELDELYPRPDEEPTRQESGSTVQEVTNASRRDSSGQGVFLGDLNKRIIASDEVTLVVTRFLRQQHPDVRSVTVSEITNITFMGAWVYRADATAAGELSNTTGSPKHFDVEVLVGKNGSVVGVNGQRWRGNFGVHQALRSND